MKIALHKGFFHAKNIFFNILDTFLFIKKGLKFHIPNSRDSRDISTCL